MRCDFACCMRMLNYGKRSFVGFSTCFFDFGREYFTPLRRFAEERFAMTLFTKNHERQGYSAWQPMCPASDLLVDVRIRS